MIEYTERELRAIRAIQTAAMLGESVIYLDFYQMPAQLRRIRAVLDDEGIAFRAYTHERGVRVVVCD